MTQMTAFSSVNVHKYVEFIVMTSCFARIESYIYYIRQTWLDQCKEMNWFPSVIKGERFENILIFSLTLQILTKSRAPFFCAEQYENDHIIYCNAHRSKIVQGERKPQIMLIKRLKHKWMNTILFWEAATATAHSFVANRFQPHNWFTLTRFCGFKLFNRNIPFTTSFTCIPNVHLISLAKRIFVAVPITLSLLKANKNCIYKNQKKKTIKSDHKIRPASEKSFLLFFLQSSQFWNWS